MGMVKTPGQYVLQPGMTVRQAISMAGGLTERGSDRRIKIIRKVEQQGRRDRRADVRSGPANDTIRVAQRLHLAPPRRRTQFMHLVIEPGLASANYWRDLWRYRELMYFLAWRDIAVRYKQTVIGVAWALLRPALTMLVFVALPAAGRHRRRRRAGRRSWCLPRCCPGSSFSTARHGVVRQPGRQRQPDLQGLFPAADHPGRGGDHRVRRFRDHARRCWRC